MLQPTINPYPFVGAKISEGLDAIAEELNPIGTPTVNDLITAVENYIKTVLNEEMEEEDPMINHVIHAVVANCINGYSNGRAGGYLLYDGMQQQFIYNLLESTLKCTADSLEDIIHETEDRITQSGLTIQQQVPLLLATEIGRKNIEYWLNIINVPPVNNWTPFIETIAGAGVTLPYWVSASMEGSLIGYNILKTQDTLPSDIITGTSSVVGFISVLAGGLVVVSGKVIFKWTPRTPAYGGYGNSYGNGMKRCNC